MKSRSEEMEALRAKAERPAAELEKLRKSAFEQKVPLTIMLKLTII